MVAVRNFEADAFIRTAARSVWLYLVFGTDAGVISERSHAILKRAVGADADAMNTIRMSGDDVAADPLKLVDEANAIGLFGGKRAIVIDAGARAFTAALETLLAAPPVDCTVVIEAGALRRDAPLRKLCTREKASAAIECYPDQTRDIERIVDEEFRAAHLNIEPDARALLVSQLGADRLATRAEIEKLVLYAHGHGRVSHDDVAAIVADASALAIDDAIDQAFAGEFGAVAEVAGRAFASGGDVNALFAAAQRQAKAMHQLRVEIEKGSSVEMAIEKTMGRDMFPARRQAIARQSTRWTAATALSAIRTLADAAQRARRDPRLAESICIRALWGVGLMARKR